MKKIRRARWWFVLSFRGRQYQKVWTDRNVQKFGRLLRKHFPSTVMNLELSGEEPADRLIRMFKTA